MTATICEARRIAVSRVQPETFEEICDGVWRDRAAVLFRRGDLSGEDALMRAVYWRLCKAGGDPERKIDGNAPLLRQLLQRYRDEAARES
jgi:hypothetical protein